MSFNDVDNAEAINTIHSSVLVNLFTFFLTFTGDTLALFPTKISLNGRSDILPILLW